MDNIPSVNSANSTFNTNNNKIIDINNDKSEKSIYYDHSTSTLINFGRSSSSPTGPDVESKSSSNSDYSTSTIVNFDRSSSSPSSQDVVSVSSSNSSQSR